MVSVGVAKRRLGLFAPAKLGGLDPGHYVGDILVWGVVTPLYAYAVLRTRVARRWIGWLGIIGVGLFAGLLDALSPASGVIEGLTFIGFVSFFVFMASLGIALLRRGRTATATPA